MAVWRSLATVLLFFVVLQTEVLVCQTQNADVISGGADDRNATGGGGASSSEVGGCSAAMVCVDGIILPAWRPIDNVGAADKAFRAVVYFLAMIYMFLGVSIIADRFMASIEVITSQEREVTIQKPSGETVVVQVRTWNETVSNLTLMALGSSAPEIMLSIIEIIGNGFNAGDLGPGTIVGSAAFNLFVIIGLCVAVIPNGETRRIKHLRVFIITASWSIFAYLWLYIIIAISSPGVVDVWEGIVTFLFFPATVISAYIADKKIFFGRFLSNRKYRARLFSTVVVAESRDNIEMGEKGPMDGCPDEDAELKEFERTRKEYIEILRELRKKHPDVDMRKLEEMAAVEVLNRGPKSRAFYRIQATRKLTGGGKIIKKKTDKLDALDTASAVAGADEAAVTRVYFEPGHYTVMENVGSFAVTVTRQGGDLDTTLYVDYRTEDGTANAGGDYVYADGTLVFFPGEVHKQFQLSIIDDDIFEEDEHFYVRLSNVRSDDSPDESTEEGVRAKAQLVNPFMATVMILDDDHAGIFHFEHPETTFPESIGEASVRVVRSSGARGVVHLPYRTIEGSAKGNNDDYEDDEGEVIFENDETEAFIKIRIINKEEYEKNVYFEIELGKPYTLDPHTGEKIEVREDVDDEELEKMTEEQRIATLGRPQLGEISKVTCNISESVEFKGVVDKLLRKANMSLVVGTSSWREQFIDAVTVRSGDDDDDDDADNDDDQESRRPSCSDYVMHSLSFFWKVLFAFVPPTDYLGGWAAFCVSILIIGLLTAIIGDIASHFGCTVGLLDAVTALSFVALGTSIPDTFASKVAAIHDAYADSSVGNVTGSNAVNVFLGIGIAWSIAAVYHAVRGTVFVVNAGSLGFSVTMFCCCAFVCIAVMLVRRLPPVHGELGGPPRFKYATSLLLFGLWIFYVLMSSLEAYCYIPGF